MGFCGVGIPLALESFFYCFIVFCPPIPITGIHILGIWRYSPTVVYCYDLRVLLRFFAVFLGEAWASTNDGEDGGFFTGS